MSNDHLVQIVCEATHPPYGYTSTLNALSICPNIFDIYTCVVTDYVVLQEPSDTQDLDVRRCESREKGGTTRVPFSLDHTCDRLILADRRCP